MFHTTNMAISVPGSPSAVPDTHNKLTAPQPQPQPQGQLKVVSDPASRLELLVSSQAGPSSRASSTRRSEPHAYIASRDGYAAGTAVGWDTAGVHTPEAISEAVPACLAPPVESRESRVGA
ncbi:unnamed protein product [Cutaneotrichosporon oleaginosum]